MIRKIAITGGRGRLAPLIAADLKARGCNVTTFSRAQGDGHFDIARLTDPSLAATFDTIMHLAWSSVPLTSEQNPGGEELSDIPFLQTLLATLEKIPAAPHFIFFSTAAVYGNCDHPASEEATCAPLGHYAAAKLQAENLIRGTGMQNCVLRISNVFGFSDHSPRPQGIIPRLCEAAHSGSPLTIWGDGTATKDYLFCADFFDAIGAVLDQRLTGTFNVASEQSLSLREIIALVELVAGKKLAVNETPHFPWDVERTLLSAKKLCAATGWRAGQDARAAIENLIRAELS